MSDLFKTMGGVVAVGDIVPSRADIEAVELEMASHPNRVPRPPHFMHKAPGIRAREVRIPAGLIVTGRTHKTRHINVLAAGEITVWTEEGMKRLAAPYVFVSEAGTKRIGRTHTDTVWITFHASDAETDEQLENEVIDASFDQPIPALVLDSLLEIPA